MLEDPPTVTLSALLADASYLTGAGVDGPCVVHGAWGTDDARLAYATECSDTPFARHALRERMEDGARVVWLGPRAPSRYFDVRWRPLELPDPTRSLPRRVWVSTSQPLGPDSDTRA